MKAHGGPPGLENFKKGTCFQTIFSKAHGGPRGIENLNNPNNFLSKHKRQILNLFQGWANTKPSPLVELKIPKSRGARIAQRRHFGFTTSGSVTRFGDYAPFGHFLEKLGVF